MSIACKGGDGGVVLGVRGQTTPISVYVRAAVMQPTSDHMTTGSRFAHPCINVSLGKALKMVFSNINYLMV